MEWISVKKQLPKKDGSYLVYIDPGAGHTYCDVLDFAIDGRKVDKYDFLREWKNVWYEYDREWGHIIIDSITHWMPLPDEPTRS